MLLIFEDNEVAIRMTVRGRSPNWEHVSRTDRVDLVLLFERFNLDSSVSIPEQLADMLTKSALANIQWKPWMRLFDTIHHQNEVSIAAFQNHLVLHSLRSLLTPCPTPSSQRDFERGPWHEKPQESSCGVDNQSSVWRTPCALRNKKARTSTHFGKTYVKKQSEEKRTATLVSSVTLQKNTSMREAMEFISQYIWDTVWSL